ncbi:MAG: carboxypeptidase-like regulatory domain-containing protein [Bacteroidetes bacterium]|nr:carboxypeptidase-like regulatory domain-containing protein [Bacteroidota bacterium]MDE2672378.1 carboxypeptidase-like regulatory domain-containing protein [Bacteroidota bacterium]
MALLFLSNAALFCGASAQDPVLTGTVADTESDRGLPRAHVFIASSMIGTTTDRDGKFVLKGVPPGAHRLVVTMLGYESVHVDTLFRAGKQYEFDFHLKSTAIQLEEIVVNARLARRWQRRLIKFTRLFVGESENSNLTSILNPEVLSFTSRLGKLSATASEPLIIENRALGYQIQYYLKEFFHYGITLKYDGEPSFTELVPTDSLEAERWRVNRQAAFAGSQRHFLLSVLAGQVEEEGFEVYRRFSLEPNSSSFTMDSNQLLEPGPSPLERILTFTGFLEVVYTKETEDDNYMRWLRQPSWSRPGPQISYMELTSGPTAIDESGEVIDPYGVKVYGYYAFESIADRVPKEYRPPDWAHR